MVIASLFCSSACVDLLDLPNNPQVVVDPWSCVGQPKEPVVPTQDKALVQVHACNFITQCATPVTGISANLCSLLDVNCTNPIQSDIRDVNGDLGFEVPTGGVRAGGFDGFLAIEPPTSLCTDQALFAGLEEQACMLAPECNAASPDDRCRIPTFANTLLFFNPPVTGDLAVPISLPLIPRLATTMLLSAVNSRPADPTDGFVLVTTLGCEGTPAAGIRLSVMPPPPRLTATLYLSEGVISSTATMTDSSGIGGLVGVPSGFQTIVASVGSGSDTREIGRAGVQVQALTASYVTIVPSADP